VLKILIGLVAGSILVSVLLFFWFSRPPTTELVDASGKELSAGGAFDARESGSGGGLFENIRARIERGEFAAAKTELVEVLEASDRDGEACVLLCDVCRELKEVDASVDYGLKATKLLPDAAEAHLAYAKALGLKMFSNMQGVGGMLSAMTQIGHFKKALHRVIELNPEDTEARTMLVFTHLAPPPFGDINTAMELSREIELRDPVRGMQLLAVCYRRNEETERAVELLLAGIEAYPEEPGFHVALAEIYADQERFDAADAEFEAARRGEKGESYYRALYGQARMRIQHEFEPERAVAWLDEFIAAEPTGEGMPSVAHALWRKGGALEQLDRSEDARGAYEESLRRDPGFKLAREALEALP